MICLVLNSGHFAALFGSTRPFLTDLMSRLARHRCHLGCCHTWPLASLKGTGAHRQLLTTVGLGKWGDSPNRHGLMDPASLMRPNQIIEMNQLQH